MKELDLHSLYSFFKLSAWSLMKFILLEESDNPSERLEQVDGVAVIFVRSAKLIFFFISVDAVVVEVRLTGIYNDKERG